MKLNRNTIFIAISSLALFILLIIQVNWILETARIKEELFNEKANMVLARTTEALRADKATCRKIEACVEKDSASAQVTKLGSGEEHTIDSLFTHYMRFYNFHIEYSFEVVKPDLAAFSNGAGFANFSYNKPLETSAGKAGITLKLIFPEKKQFIIAEMGPMFIASVVLILVVLVLFWRTILSLLKEKKIAEHTNEFLNNMTHEFKTPLTNIALAAKMLQKDAAGKPDGKSAHYSGVILEENEKLRLQVEQVLGMTGLERGEIPLRKSALDVHSLINDLPKSSSVQIEHRHGKLQVHLDAKKVMVLADKTHLTNAFSNLMDNAIKYSTGNPEIAISSFNSGQDLVIVFADQGIGIERDYQKKVFDKYFRVPTGDVHDVKGFGLGLAYVKKIVALHEGSIELQSEKGKGTIFTITLPNV